MQPRYFPTLFVNVQAIFACSEAKKKEDYVALTREFKAAEMHLSGLDDAQGGLAEIMTENIHILKDTEDTINKVCT